MITQEKLQQLLEKGLDMNHYLVIHYLVSGVEISQLLSNLKVFSWVTTLERKELIIKAGSNYHLTDEGKKIYDSQVVAVPKIVVTEQSIEDLHTKIQERLFKHTKKKQIMGFGNTYFIPTTTELNEFLNRFRRKYPNLWNMEKIEKVLFSHIDRCCKTQKFAPAIKYFIIKDGTGSQLAPALENMEDTVEEKEQQYDIVNTKDLFS